MCGGQFLTYVVHYSVVSCRTVVFVIHIVIICYLSEILRLNPDTIDSRLAERVSMECATMCIRVDLPV